MSKRDPELSHALVLKNFPERRKFSKSTVRAHSFRNALILAWSTMVIGALTCCILLQKTDENLKIEQAKRLALEEHLSRITQEYAELKKQSDLAAQIAAELAQARAFPPWEKLR
ncbi:MAG: hypothetical protein SH807_10600 [Blastochloris sp.]|nr:hypothetical protein [Blastochloris sp.]